jgi:hypothetical protein
MQRLNHQLDCKSCGTIYLDIPDNVTGASIGYWGDLSRDFDRQGGQHGVFELKDGQIERKE